MPPNDDILREILIRLPAESMIRSRAVCKRWRAVIDEPPFARAHQHQPINKSKFFILTDSPSTYCSLDLEDLSFSNGHQTIDAMPLDFSGDFLRSPVSACKGLVLTSKPLEILNPSTHERLDLPLPPGDSSGHAAAVYGLGYDYVTDDYKAVLISISWRSLHGPHRTHVYSLKSDSWRTITNCPRYPKENPGVFVGGALNWLPSGAGYSRNASKIIALDLGTEKYTLLPMPRSRREDQFKGYELVLDVLGGCLILCDSSYNTGLDIWVMKDYGKKASWMVLFSIDRLGTYGGKLSSVGFIMRKEEEEKMGLQVFLLVEDYFVYFLFDVKTGSRKRIFVQDVCRVFRGQQIFTGTKFCLHANCGGGGGGARPRTSSSSSRNKNSADLVKRVAFFIEDFPNERPYSFRRR